MKLELVSRCWKVEGAVKRPKVVLEDFLGLALRRAVVGGKTF